MIWPFFRRNPSHSDRRLSVQIAILTAALALAVYVRTSSPRRFSSAGDSAELTTVRLYAGGGDAPGYPLFTLLGIWSAASLPGMPPTGSSFSPALCGSLAILNTYFVAALVDRTQGDLDFRGVDSRFFLSTLWLYSLIPEVAGGGALFRFIAVFCSCWRRQPSPPDFPAVCPQAMMLAFCPRPCPFRTNIRSFYASPRWSGFVYLTRRERERWRVGFREAFFIRRWRSSWDSLRSSICPFRAPPNAVHERGPGQFAGPVHRRTSPAGATAPQGSPPQFSEWTFHGVSTDLQFYRRIAPSEFFALGRGPRPHRTRSGFYRRDAPGVRALVLAFG